MPDYLDLPDRALAALGLTPKEIADAVEAALLEQAAGRLHTAPKAAITPGDGRYIMSTLASGDDPALTVIKAVTVSPENPDQGLPAINGAITVFDSRTGLLRAVMGANWITAVRTAGLSVVAARRLANPHARHVAFVGCGVQASSHLDALAAHFPIERISCFGRGMSNIERLCAEARGLGLQAEVFPEPHAATAEADIVVSSITATTTKAPFIDAHALKPGSFATLTDLARAWLPQSLPAFDTIYVDDLAQEAAMATKLAPPELVAGDLAGLVTAARPARFDPRQRTAFIFRGQALGDWAAATLALSRAEALQGKQAPIT